MQQQRAFRDTRHFGHEQVSIYRYMATVFKDHAMRCARYGAGPVTPYSEDLISDEGPAALVSDFLTGEIVTFNHAMCETIGQLPNVLVGRAVWTVVPPDALDQALAFRERVWLEGSVRSDARRFVLCRDGRQRDRRARGLLCAENGRFLLVEYFFG